MDIFISHSDHELLLSVQRGELGAFKEIYGRYWKKMYSQAFKRLKSKELAEEVVQEIFTNLWLKRYSLESTVNIAGYLHLAVYNSVIDLYRKELVQAKYKEAFKMVHSESDNTMEDSISLKELTHTIQTEVSHLPDKCRSVYELSRNQHKSNKEIAVYLGISEKNR